MPPGTIKPKPSRSRVKVKKRAKVLLLTRASIDGRGPAARAYDRLARSIETDLGGASQLSSIEASLIEAFCGSATLIDHMNAKLLLGEEIDVSAHAATVSALVRVASRLGLRRRSKDITPSLVEYLALRDLEAREAKAAHNGTAHEFEEATDADSA
jgi:hypothetical protein